MREKPNVLIATTNTGKFREAVCVLEDLPFTFVSLADVGFKGIAPEETENTLEGNAMLKAKYYGELFAMPAIADDSGLFIDALSGWPGVLSARIAQDTQSQNALLLDRMAGIPDGERSAVFCSVLAMFDTRNKNIFLATGEARGEILTAPVAMKNGFGYDPIFFYPPLGKTFADITVTEKNAVSHRGKALFRMKYILENEYGGKHLVVPVAMIVRDGLVLMAKRNDPHRSDFHGKWEFPGGRMDVGETLEENLTREVSEEVGCSVKIIKRFDHIAVEYQTGADWGYQVYILPYLCQWTGKNGNGSDAEVMETRWFDPDAVAGENLIGANREMYQAILPELKILSATL